MREPSEFQRGPTASRALVYRLIVGDLPPLLPDTRVVVSLTRQQAPLANVFAAPQQHFGLLLGKRTSAPPTLHDLFFCCSFPLTPKVDADLGRMQSFFMFSLVNAVVTYKRCIATVLFLVNAVVIFSW